MCYCSHCCSDGNSFRLHGDADVRAGLTSERLAFVQARLSRHPNFATPLPGSELPNYVAITRIDRLSVAPAGSALTLLGTLTQVRRPVMSCLISDEGWGGRGRSQTCTHCTSPHCPQPEDGLLAVEDVSGRSVALDVSRADTLHGMVTVGCVVLLQGVYDADGSPPTAVAAAAAAAQNPLLMQQQGQGQGQFSRGPGLGHPARQAQGGPSSGPAYSAAAAALPPSVGGSTLSSGGAPPSVLGPLRQGASSMLEHAVPGVFRVAAVAHPPCEARDDTLRAMGIVDPLRLHDTPADAARAAAQEASREERRVTWAVLSHVHLDAPGCLDMLGDLLAGFSAARSLPAVLVLMGDFLCAPYGSRPGDRDRLCRLMASLADTLAAHPAFLASAHVVLVPGPHDPGAPGVSPHLPLLSHFCAPLLDRQRFPRLTLSTSPARLSFYTREVVLWRDEPTLKLRRCSVLPLAPGIEPSEHVRTALLPAPAPAAHTHTPLSPPAPPASHRWRAPSSSRGTSRPCPSPCSPRTGRSTTRCASRPRPTRCSWGSRRTPTSTRTGAAAWPTPAPSATRAPFCSSGRRWGAQSSALCGPLRPRRDRASQRVQGSIVG